MATYTLTLTSTGGDRAVGAWDLGNPQTWGTSFAASKPSDWPFTNASLFTIDNVKLTFTGAQPGYDGWSAQTWAGPANAQVTLDGSQIFSKQLNGLSAGTSDYNLGAFSIDSLCSSFSTLHMHFNGYRISNINAFFYMPYTIQLVFTYELNYTQLPAPTWNISTTNYTYNGKIYVSNSSSTPSGKNKLTLKWNTPTASGTPDTLSYYTLKAQINNGTTYTILTTSSNSYTVDFSNFKYNNGANTLSLSQGATIVFKISTTGVHCGTSSDRSFSFIYINYWPTRPTISNTIIPSTQTSSTFRYSLGTDSTHENMPVSFRWKQNSSSTWLTSTSINNSMVGTHYAYTYDNWDISSPTSFTISKNKKPIVTFTATFSASSTGYTNNTITITNIAETGGKTLKNIRYYIRTADTQSLVSAATIKTLPLSNNTYVINPFDISSLVYAAQYYQVGVQANDGIEDSDITWSNIVQIYGGINLLENSPTIFHTDTTTGSGNYAAYYKNKTINLAYQLPELPVGLSKLYYQIAYLSNAQTNTWSLLGNRVLFTTSYTLNTQVTIPTILSSLVLRVNIYNADVEETQVVYSNNSNTLYYANAPTWGNIQGSLSLAYADFNDGTMAADSRYCIRPTLGDTLFTSDGKSVSAFSITIPIPNSICEIAGYPTDLLYQISVIRNNNNKILQSYQSVPNYKTNNPNFIKSFTYKQLQDLNIYKLCANEIEDRIGPYTLSLVVTFKDPFNSTIETLKSDLIIDFREKPAPAQNILLGRNGVYNSNNYTEELKNLITSETILFPSTLSNSTSADYVILNNEVLLVSFSQELSYPAQQIEEYYFDLYNKTNELIKTFIVQPIDNIEYYEVPINNLFQGYGEYYLKIRAKDVQSYSQNISLDENKSNNLFGVAREKPIISLHSLDISFTDSSIEYTIPALSFSEQSNSINVLWPDSYIQTRAYNRLMVYDSISYIPHCIYSLEFSAFPDFSTVLKEINLGEIFNDYYDNLEYTGFSSNLEDTSITKIYIRGKIEYTTGLGCVGSLETPTGLTVDTQVIYSPIISFIGDQPTASYRKNAVGINSLPNLDEVFSVSSFGTKNIISFSGEDGEDVSVRHALYFDLSEGKIITENFDLGIENMPIVTETEINNFSFKT